MATATARRLHTLDEYLERDAQATDVRYEYLNGRTYALAGASLDHNQIKDNVRTALHTQTASRGCRSVTSHQRVSLDERYVYPDVVMVCDTPEMTDETPSSLRNPLLLVEVTSESTERRDATEKLEAYLTLDALQEYWLIDPAQALVVRYHRSETDWRVTLVRGLDATLTSDALDVQIPMADVYTLVDAVTEAPDDEARTEGDEDLEAS
ncbi:Uma2 family endonuclease [Salisaeta longa]|uniref:Uma2 family endonuclease n=1 Tax=Salisaeta longa TaxID=503170 RepID=UPI0003B5EE34|nr:Uma2 family endonuclease [Salisaeta longa]